MVFKWLSLTKVNDVVRDRWNYIDKVDEVQVEYNDEMDLSVATLRIHDSDPIKIGITAEAYLMSDDGKTIERIREEHPRVAVIQKKDELPVQSEQDDKNVGRKSE